MMAGPTHRIREHQALLEEVVDAEDQIEIAALMAVLMNGYDDVRYSVSPLFGGRGLGQFVLDV